MATMEIEWATREFGDADVGDARRTDRLVRVAAAAAARPAGRITDVMKAPADRRGAFRLMGNRDAAPDEVAKAAHRACASAVRGQGFVFVPVDGSSLNITDLTREKDLGIVGPRWLGGTGLHVMSAIAVAPDGTPLGICGQTWWARKGRARRAKHDKRLVASKETQHWLTVMQQVRDVFSEQAPTTRPWFQLDRGGDAWPVVLDGLQPGQLFTVRVVHNRRLLSKQDEPRRYLWGRVESQAPLGRYSLPVPARPRRAARTACIEVRGCEVTLDMLDERTRGRHQATLWALLAREVGTAPSEEEAIEWLLLTTHSVKTLADGKLVLFGYAQRWRIEDFHRLWKTGACNVEETQLRDREAIIRWATILASVAMRILRLTYLARRQPELPATTELTQTEVDAIVAITKPAGVRMGQPLPIGQVVLWLAEIGGYTGKSSGGPPGAIVIGRALKRIRILVDYLAGTRQM